MKKNKKGKEDPIRIEVNEAHEHERTRYRVRTSGDVMTACWLFYCTVPDLITRITKEMPNGRRYEFEATSSDIFSSEGKSTTSDLTVDEGRAIAAVIDLKNTIYQAKRSLEEIFGGARIK